MPENVCGLGASSVKLEEPDRTNLTTENNIEVKMLFSVLVFVLVELQRTSIRGLMCVSQPESASQIAHHDIPTSQNDTTTHLANTSVQSRDTSFSPQNFAANRTTMTNTPTSYVPLSTPGLHVFHTPNAQGPQHQTVVPAPSTGCGLYNLKQSIVLKLNKPDDSHLPTWFENAESHYQRAGVSTEED